MKTKYVLLFNLVVMGALIGYALIFPQSFVAFIERPELFLHAKFVHVLSVTLFFANAVIGTIWETRSLLSGKPDIIRYTYGTVVWLDAVFTAPLIIISVLSGLMLGTILGGVWSMGWLSLAFLLFLGGGLVWIIADIPTQYRVKQLFAAVQPGSETLPPELTRLLWMRLGINFLGIAPLVVILFLMIHKPEVPAFVAWLKNFTSVSGTHHQQ